LNGVYREQSKGKEWATLLLALFSDGWTKNFTKKSSFEAFHLSILNQGRVERNQTENIFSLASTNTVRWGDAMTVISDSIKPLHEGFR